MIFVAIIVILLFLAALVGASYAIGYADGQMNAEEAADKKRKGGSDEDI